MLTAQRRTERLQDVPISLQVMTGENLERSGASTFAAIKDMVPSLQIQSTPSNKYILVRGLGTVSPNPSLDQSVSLYLDGLYAGRNRQVNPPLYDIARFEVYRGPQGALLGKNTASGAISVVTRDPNPNRAEYGGDALYNFSRQGIDLFGFASSPLTDTLSARLALKYTNMPGYVHNTVTGKDNPKTEDFSGRLTLKFSPSSDVDAVLKVQIDRLRTSGTNFVTSAPGVKPVYESNAIGGFGYTAGDRQNGENGTLKIDYQLGGATLSSISGYAAYRGRQVSPASQRNPELLVAVYDEDFKQYSQELRLTSETGKPIEYIFGLYYDHSKYFVGSPLAYALAGGGAVEGKFNQDSDTYSAYGQLTWHVSEGLRALGSLRYTNTLKDADFALISVSGTPLKAPFSIPRQERSEVHVDPSITLQADVSRDVMVYATYARGSKSGGFVSNTRTVTPATFSFSPEQSRNIEAGIKSQFFDRRVTVNLSAYSTKVTDLQVSTYVPALATFVTNNAASATSKGVEGTLEIAPATGFRLSSSIAYADVTYDDYPGAACLAGAPPSCTPATNNLAGYPLFGSSKWSGTVQGNYETSLGSGLRLALQGTMMFRSSFVSSFDYSPVYGIQHAYQKYDASIEIGSEDDRWTVALIGRNLTDKRTESFNYVFAGVVHALEEPRSIAIQTRLRF
ncbi:TonB-dependent receptor [Sphingobium fuliginis]|jgi:iron complex outermembrane receptor protein|uniref:Outer membrane receptor protein n=1 Tax=Sphingobium fuliginis (strain ATCC 27551) TaxID=336203 RepID=A0A292ZAY2_SPHSA|nr:TonB-dependent receptor [Sphingobium fuliginis]GAY19994.1 outer membrane receptor protein [Sphingobium fuliginis]